ncbi:serine hydrolase [Sandaracinobacter neustonicus]|uniref:Serine hydrolase n=1 Tax=Sandaracinobacter neustonicus TaxID=1715348 RepID=A0A501XTH1_9SPHN|nr:serine hydrolase [Sandaracinobacter neustonicus]TPE63729.1 serine hydrolase [Sandaracinobacter neustonicus]
MVRARWFATAHGVALALALVSAVPAPVVAKSAASLSSGQLADLPAFIDGVMAQQIATREVAGAVVTVVSGGRVIFNKGYGFADVDRRIPVDANKTLFRPGSVSKLFTWTALMQQVEAGRVSLDDEVNKYLDFRIPDTQSRPILVRHLMDHTPGFEDRSAGIMSKTPADFVPLGEFLKANIPTRVREPGIESSYSNYATALAGYIVERVSGEPFPDYVERHIFQPLKMPGATFREPLTGSRAENMALGYELKDGRFIARPFELYHNIMPAGSASATGPDMARFMLMHLGDGKLDGARILQAKTMQQMRQTLHRNAPSLPGFAHGYMVLRDEGPRMIGHGGNTADFHSMMVLVPETGFGFYISMTGGNGSYGGRTELQNAIIGRLFPTAPAPRWAGTSASPAGTYRINRRTYSEPPLPQHDIKVVAAGPNELVLQSADGTTSFWEQTGPDRYEKVTAMRAGGPFETILFHGPEEDRRLSFSSQPHVLYRLVR